MITFKLGRNLASAAVAASLMTAGISGARAQTIIDTWGTVTMPPPPAAVQPVTVDSAHTALIILDMYPTSCVASERPRCVPTIPRIQRLLAAAREHHMMVVYTAGPVANNGPVLPVDALLPQAGEPTVRGPADKFIGSNLEALLTARGIRSVILVGTSADAAIMYTASHAAFLNLATIVPVDGISSKSAFAEAYTVYHLRNTATTVTRNVTLTQTDMITMH